MVTRLLTVLVLLTCGSAFAAHPGKVNFDSLMDLDDTKTIAQVQLSGWLMNLIQTAAKEDPDAAIFSGIDEINVRVFEVDDSKRYRKLAGSLHGDLADRGWDDLAQVRDDGDVVHVMVKGSDDQLDGLTVMAVDSGGEAVFVNIVGHIDPRDLAKLMKQVDVGGSHIDFDW